MPLESDQATRDPPTTPARDRFRRLSEMPPSAKLVYYVLDKAEKPLPSGEIATRTLLADRTTRYAINKLREADVVTERRALTDARKPLYELETVERP